MILQYLLLLNILTRQTINSIIQHTMLILKCIKHPHLFPHHIRDFLGILEFFIFAVALLAEILHNIAIDALQAEQLMAKLFNLLSVKSCHGLGFIRVLLEVCETNIVDLRDLCHVVLELDLHVLEKLLFQGRCPNSLENRSDV